MNTQPKLQFKNKKDLAVAIRLLVDTKAGMERTYMSGWSDSVCTALRRTRELATWIGGMPESELKRYSRVFWALDTRIRSSIYPYVSVTQWLEHNSPTYHKWRCAKTEFDWREDRMLGTAHKVKTYRIAWVQDMIDTLAAGGEI